MRRAAEKVRVLERRPLEAEWFQERRAEVLRGAVRECTGSACYCTATKPPLTTENHQQLGSLEILVRGSSWLLVVARHLVLPK